MKKFAVAALAAILVIGSAAVAGADTVLFSDNYNVSGPYNTDINHEYNSGTRQGGVTSPLLYSETPSTGAGAQLNGLSQLNADGGIGALSLFSSGAWGSDSSYLWASPNKNFKDYNQVTIEFDLDPNANDASAPGGIWAGVVFGTDVQGSFVWPQRGTYGTPISPSGGIGFVIDNVGNTFIFEDDWPNSRQGNIAIHDGFYHMKVVIDTPGFGSGQPANIGLFVDGNSVLNYTRTAGFNNNFITLAGNSADSALVQHAFDNLVVSTTAAVPEPGSLLVLGSGVLGIAGSLIRRRRR